jgi:hypothetical protein
MAATKGKGKKAAAPAGDSAGNDQFNMCCSLFEF